MGLICLKCARQNDTVHQQVRRFAHQMWIVEEDFQELMFASVVTIDWTEKEDMKIVFKKKLFIFLEKKNLKISRHFKK